MAPIFLAACILALGLSTISEAIENAQEGGQHLSINDRAGILCLGVIGVVCVAVAFTSLD